MLRFLLISCKPIILLLVIFISTTSCNVSQKIEKRGGYLLTRNVIKTDRPEIVQSDILNFAQPKPNRRFLGLIKSRVWIYDAFGRNQDNRFNRWMIKNFGELPVLLDTIMVHNSLIPMNQYLINKGYFKSNVQSNIKIRGSRAEVTYTTTTKEPYVFDKIDWQISDDTLRKIIMREESLLKSGNQYDSYKMTYERDRLTQLLKNNGYYAFSSNYIFFEVDTINIPGLANLRIIIKNRGNESEDLHKRYIFNKIIINTDYLGLLSDSLVDYDTLAYKRSLNSNGLPDFYEIFRTRLRLRPQSLARAIYIKPGAYYSQRDVNLTYNRLQNLGLTRYVSINMIPPDDSAFTVMKGEELIDSDIRMVRAPVSAFTVEAEGTNADGFMGLGASVNYINRNIFVGAETWRIKVFGAFETRPELSRNDEKLIAIFNSMEGGFETGIDFPTLLSPIPIRHLGQNSRPKTSFNLGYSYELRSEYERSLSKLSLVYEWSASQTTRHFFSPIDLSSISIVRDSAFNDYLTKLNDPRFLNQYTNHLILASKYSFVYNNQNITNRKNFLYFKINFEPAGNLFNLFSKISQADRDEEGKYTLLNIKYSQYFRFDWDLRYYRPLFINQRLVYRLAFGIGVAYGNSISLPFEKGFFAGGANGMRGWAVRALGPGQFSSNESNRFENVGDLWMEGNIEYRFPIYRYLNGGLFTDLGNIWLLKENVDFDGGTFTFDNALKSIAWDAGFGLRFDFSIFVFRVDGGLPLYDPGKDINQRFVTSSRFQLRDINWNFGIGYPF